MFEKLEERRNQLIKEIEEHYNMKTYDVASDKKLSKEKFFLEREKQIDEIDMIWETELF